MRKLTTLCRKNGMTLADLARRLNRPRDTVKKWGAEVPVPAEAVPALVAAFDGAVKAHDLRPDLYSPSDRPALRRRTVQHEGRAA
jgi:hypothetical protein